MNKFTDLIAISSINYEIKKSWSINYEYKNEEESDDDEEHKNKSKRMKISKNKYKSRNKYENIYILNIDYHKNNKENILLHLSNENLNILNVDTFNTIRKIFWTKLNNELNTMARYLNENLIMLTNDHVFSIIDLREKNLIKSSIKINLEHQYNGLIINSYDINCDNQNVAIGTEIASDKNCYLFVYDIRKTKQPLKTFTDSHSEDISSVKFHPTNKSVLASGSDDELINIYDIEINEEDEDLLYSLNTQQSISKLRWLENKETKLLSIMQDDTVQLWDYNDIKPTIIIDKNNDDNQKHTNLFDNCKYFNLFNYDYCVDAINLDNDSLYLAFGNKEGQIAITSLDYNDIDIYQNNIETLSKDKDDDDDDDEDDKKEDNPDDDHDEEKKAKNKMDDNLNVYTVLDKGHYSYIRALNCINETLLTGGEDGLICYWGKRS